MSRNGANPYREKRAARYKYWIQGSPARGLKWSLLRQSRRNRQCSAATEKLCSRCCAPRHRDRFEPRKFAATRHGAPMAMARAFEKSSISPPTTPLLSVAKRRDRNPPLNSERDQSLRRGKIRAGRHDMEHWFYFSV